MQRDGPKAHPWCKLIAKRNGPVSSPVVLTLVTATLYGNRGTTSEEVYVY